MERNNTLWVVIVALIALSFLNSSSSGNLTGRYSTDPDRGILSCYDSDGGINTFTRGYVETNTGGRLEQYNDECASGGYKVKEYYCIGNRQEFTERRCPDEFVCKNDKCERDSSSNYY